MTVGENALNQEQGVAAPPAAHTVSPPTPLPSAPPNGSASAPIGSRSTLGGARSEEHTSELQSHLNLVCRLLLEKKKKKAPTHKTPPPLAPPRPTPPRHAHC